MKPNFKFFIYAYPAMGGCCGMEKQEMDGYLEMILNENVPGENEMNEMFPAAEMRREERYGEFYWNFVNTQDYWWVEHNRIIDAGEKGYEDAGVDEKELCKVKFWEIARIGIDGLIELKNEDDFAKGYNYRKLDLKPGKYVTTHKGFVIEEISKEDFSHYG